MTFACGIEAGKRKGALVRFEHAKVKRCEDGQQEHDYEHGGVDEGRGDGDDGGAHEKRRRELADALLMVVEREVLPKDEEKHHAAEKG